MSVFYQYKKDRIKLVCDGCGFSPEPSIFEGQSDRLIANGYMHEEGWQITKCKQKWIHLCPECKKAIQEKKRAEFASKYTEEK